MTAATLGIVSLVGAGVSAASQWSQAKAQERIAKFNFAVEQSNARLAMLSQLGAIQQQRAASAVALRQAEINFALAQSEAAARDANAARIRQAADARAAGSREEIRRKQIEFAKFKAMQRARIAGSGVVESTGSPLEMLAETAGQMQLAVEEMHAQANIDRSTAYNEAEMESFGARLMRAGASSQFAISQASEKLRGNAFRMEESAARSRASQAGAMAEINRMVAGSNASGQKMAAVGTLFTGIGNYAATRSRFTYSGVA